MNFKEMVKKQLLIREANLKVRTEKELDDLYKKTAKILGISSSVVKNIVIGPHSEDGPGFGLNIVTPKQLAKELKDNKSI